MAKYVVKWGDTLSEIARDNNTTVKKIMAINKDIVDANKIYVDQTLYTDPNDVAQTIKGDESQNRVEMKQFGALSDPSSGSSQSSPKLFAIWDWWEFNEKNQNVEKFQVKWEYRAKINGNLVWINASSTYNQVDDKDKKASCQSEYSVPAEAVAVRFNVKPIRKENWVANIITSLSEKYGKVTKKIEWTGEWLPSDQCVFYPKDTSPAKPGSPSVKIEGTKLTATLDNIDLSAQNKPEEIEFRIVKNDNPNSYSTVTADIKSSTGTTGFASCVKEVDAGGKYKVACRAIRNGLYSAWSDYSSNESAAPSAPKKITTLKTLSENSVYIEWEKVASADDYVIEYTTDKTYFDSSNEVQSTSVKATVTHAEITGLTTGYEYFFRVKATNEGSIDGSGWTAIKSIIVGKKPAAPTTWSSTTTAIVGEPMNLYWVHNAEDESNMTNYQIELTVNGSTSTITGQNENPDDDEETTNTYTLNTSSYSEGAEILWRVRTAGILKDSNGGPAYGDWSAQRAIDIYARPSVELGIFDRLHQSVEVIREFPFYIQANANPNNRYQYPIGYHINIVSDDSYLTVDAVGNDLLINEGYSVFSRYLDNIPTDGNIELMLSAGDVDLENNRTYSVTVTTTMSSGLTASQTLPLSAVWSETRYEPSAEVAIDLDTYTASIKPYCESMSSAYHVVENIGDTYAVTAKVISFVSGTIVPGVYTTTGETVYNGYYLDPDNDYNEVDCFYCTVTERTPIKDVTLSVYRREFDGRFTPILPLDLTNDMNLTVTDPHPALDYARYRIVARDEKTGAINFTDMTGVEVGCKSVIIQWDEKWSAFDTPYNQIPEQPPWTGSLLKLPYNIDVSDNHSPDVELVEYLGREHPVSYYGTQRGESATWNVEIVKKDIDTLYALRRLANWMGDVYVREPSGSGYWAHVVVSFSQRHCEVTIPVTFDIKRVEGGM